MLATQTLPQRRPKTLRVHFDGSLPLGLTAKDMILGAIGQLGVDGGVGHAIEYTGEAIEALSMEGRMTVCNMSIEAGARAGMIAPDETTFAYLEGRPGAPKGAAWEQALDRWRALPSDPGRGLRRHGRGRRLRAQAAGDLGHEPGHGRAGGRRRSRSLRLRRSRRARRGRARARVHGARAGHGDRRHPRRPRLHRLVHELAARGSARGRRGRARQAGAPLGARDGRPRLGGDQGAGRGRRGSTGSSTTPASSGARPAARCASA